MTTAIVDLDVRQILRDGGEPFEKIMNAVDVLKPGQGLRLLATFKPTPLLHVLGSRGFVHEVKETGDGDWEVVFRPTKAGVTSAAPAMAAAAATSVWPEPTIDLDNRDLDPPEPMVRILAAIEELTTGEVLSALLCREPIFLFPELAKRGHAWRGGFEDDGRTYRLLVRAGSLAGAAS